LGLKFSIDRGNVSDEHREIADAAVARDATLAVRLLYAHFSRTVEQVDQAIRNKMSENKKAGSQRGPQARKVRRA
jgi:DNA-binding GntR family transcriptional regulator